MLQPTASLRDRNKRKLKRERAQQLANGQDKVHDDSIATVFAEPVPNEFSKASAEQIKMIPVMPKSTKRKRGPTVSAHFVVSKAIKPAGLENGVEKPASVQAVDVKSAHLDIGAANCVEESLARSTSDTVSTTRATAPESVKRRKRSRKRNHNKLLEVKLQDLSKSNTLSIDGQLDGTLSTTSLVKEVVEKKSQAIERRQMRKARSKARKVIVPSQVDKLPEKHATAISDEQISAVENKPATETKVAFPKASQDMRCNKDAILKAPVNIHITASSCPRSQDHNLNHIAVNQNQADSETTFQNIHPKTLDKSDQQIERESRVSPKDGKPKRPPARSPYFSPPATPKKTSKSKNLDSAEDAKAFTPSPRKRQDAGITSCIPFPPLSDQYFGLIQEKLAHDPFRLLIAVTFLNRTHGKHAIPVFYKLMERYPTPELLAAASKSDIVSIIHRLGFQNQRADTYLRYASIWTTNPPMKGKRYAARDYPHRGCGRDVSKDEVISDDDPRSAWELAHLTSGRYALDSWRIFSRDILRGVASSFNGEKASEANFQPEWMRVQPEDKELRAFLRWMWLKEGFEWDPITGDKEVARPEMMSAAIEGRIAWDDKGGMRMLDGIVDPDTGEVGIWTQDGDLEYLTADMQICR